MTHKISNELKILYVPYWLSEVVMKQIPNINVTGLDLSFMKAVNKEDIYNLVELNKRLLEVVVAPSIRLFPEFETYHSDDIFMEDMETSYKEHVEKMRAQFIKDKLDGNSNENPHYFNITSLGLIDRVEYLPKLNLLLLLDTNDNEGTYLDHKDAYTRLKALTYDISIKLIPYLGYDNVAKMSIFKFYASEENELASVFRALGYPE